MGGIFGVISETNCAKALFYGTDYHSHLGTENAGLAIWGGEGFSHTIHSISQAQFKSRFVGDYKEMINSGNRTDHKQRRTDPQSSQERHLFQRDGRRRCKLRRVDCKTDQSG
jgi:hypothetical protein